MLKQTKLWIFFLSIWVGLCAAYSINARIATQDPTVFVLIGWDGADRRAVNKMMARGKLPNLRALSKKGSFVDINVQGTTDTRAGWAEILTGCDPSVTGVFSNMRYNAIPCGHTIFERLKYHFGAQGIATAAFIAKQGYVLTGPSPFNAIDEFKDGLLRDSVAAGEAISFIQRHRNGRFFLFVHFDGPDKQGHGYGEFSREYRRAIQEADRQTGIILKRLRESNLMGKTAVYVTADHGFDKGKTTHKNAPEVFLASNDPAITVSGNRADITPTILYRAGIAMDETTPQVSGMTLSAGKSNPRAKKRSWWLSGILESMYLSSKPRT
jgi:hypothetical protein